MASSSSRRIGIRTVFNLLGPLTNPAKARFQLVGVFSQDLVRPISEVYAELGSEHILVVCSDDGLDEISVAASTRVAEYRHGEFSEYEICPEQFGFVRSSLDGLVVGDARESLDRIRSVLAGEKGAAYDIVAMNAGATIYAGEQAGSLSEGMDMARSILDSGQGNAKLDELAALSNSFQ